MDKAVKAARKAFATWSQTSREERLDLLQAILAEYQKRAGDLAEAVTEEMGAPASLASGPRSPSGSATWHRHRGAEDFHFEEQRGATLIVKEPIGVCGLITPWNWPMNQIVCKVSPALATGCTMVLKPSEVAPYSAQIFAEILHAAGVPAGVFNLVHGDGPGVGAALSSHPDVDMVSFTGSTRAGIEVAKNAAPTVKRVAQELGGKSPNIVLDDADFAKNVAAGVATMMLNSGQTCNAPVAHAGAERPHGRGHRGRPRGRRAGDRRRPERQPRHRAGGLEGPVRQDPGADPEGHRRGRHAGRRRHRAGRTGWTRATTSSPPSSPTSPTR